MYWDHLVKIDTALYPISTQHNLAVLSENIRMLLNPINYDRQNRDNPGDYPVLRKQEICSSIGKRGARSIRRHKS